MFSPPYASASSHSSASSSPPQRTAVAVGSERVFWLDDLGSNFGRQNIPLSAFKTYEGRESPPFAALIRLRRGYTEPLEGLSGAGGEPPQVPLEVLLDVR